jgi:hypothetical protein
MHTRYALALALLLTGCTTALTPEGARVRIVTANELDKCAPITDLTSVRPSSGQMDSLNDLRNKTARMGGNAILIESTKDFVVAGYSKVTALKCQEPANPPAR